MISIILLSIFGSLLGIAIVYMLCSLSKTCYELHKKDAEYLAEPVHSFGTDSGEKRCQELMDQQEDNCESIV